MKGQSHVPIPNIYSYFKQNKFVEDKNGIIYFGNLYGCYAFCLYYNFFIYLSIKERSYLYYLIYIVCSMAFYLGLSGFGFGFFGQTVPLFKPNGANFCSKYNKLCDYFIYV
ncbi:MAG: hypothetical protein IPN10_07695 [Saprospiraceae bacterium]|nr:hypothetical protein [Saprospiraceae bacterium]